MVEWLKSKLNNEEDRFGIAVTGVVHLLIIIFAVFYQIRLDLDNRPSYMEVTLGEFQSGSMAEFAEQQPEEVATTPEPVQQQPEEPEPEVPEPVETPEQVTDETARQVDLSDQLEDIEAEVLETPDSEQIDPQVTPQQDQQEVVIPPLTQEDDQVQEGEEISGDLRGSSGDIDVEQGTGRDSEVSSPYDLRWEGDLDRSPLIQPLPEHYEDATAEITVRFEVFPNGSIGQIIPEIRMHPELEREVRSTLRNWRFSRLPTGAPQEPQWGRITFFFVFD